ncbi:MAG: nitroreductase family protein [Methylococcaceae bacterium]|jgi:nitroreductase
MPQKPAQTQVAINDLMKQRWSTRAFDPVKPISNNDLLALLEAARWAPSSFNDQPWRFIVFNKTVDPVAWQQAQSTLIEKNRQWAKNAPVLILASAMANFGHNGQANPSSQYDTGAASVSLCLQAAALGLVSHQMGGFDKAKAKDLFKLPNECQPIAMIAVGYQAELAILDDEFKAAEIAPRSRAQIGDRFFAGCWNNPY